jgi:hypothetical protein
LKPIFHNLGVRLIARAFNGDMKYGSTVVTVLPRSKTS